MPTNGIRVTSSTVRTGVAPISVFRNINITNEGIHDSTTYYFIDLTPFIFSVFSVFFLFFFFKRPSILSEASIFEKALLRFNIYSGIDITRSFSFRTIINSYFPFTQLFESVYRIYLFSCRQQAI